MRGMKKDFFVTLNHPSGGSVPMVDEHDDLATFDSEAEARDAAMGTFLGQNCGFEIFERGTGE